MRLQFLYLLDESLVVQGQQLDLARGVGKLLDDVHFVVLFGFYLHYFLILLPNELL